MKTKLLFDENMHLPLAKELRKRGYDAVHIQEVGRKGYDDPEQLAYAVQKERCIITFDRGDYVKLHNHYVQNKQDH